MTVRSYSSLDTGAPAFTSSTSTQECLRTILMACLVNGFGSNPAAGWTVGHDVTDGFSLYNGDGYANFVYNANTSSILYLMESITDGTTALASGVNRRSGNWFDGSTNTAKQYLYLATTSASASVFWNVVADEKTCYVQLIKYLNSSSYFFSVSFGNYKNSSDLTGPAVFSAFGGSRTATTTSIVGGSSESTNFAGTLLRNPWTGLVDQGTSPQVGAVAPCSLQSQSTNGSGPRPYSVVPKLYLQPLAVGAFGPSFTDGSTYAYAEYAGAPRGLLTDPFIAGADVGSIFPLLGFSQGASNNISRVSRYTLPSGKQVMFWTLSWSNSRNILISLDDEDWQ